MPFLASEGCFWPLAASVRSDVKNNYAHVKPYRILNIFCEIKFSVGCLVWSWSRVWLCQDILGLLMRCYRDVGRCENAPLCSGYNVTAGTYSQYLGPKFQTLQHQTILRNCRRCVLWGFLLPKKKKLMIFLESLLPGGMKWRSLTLRTFILGGKLVMCWMTCTNWNHLRLTRRFFEKLKYPPNNLNMTFE